MSRATPFVCIYCKEFGKNRGREHVVPKAFGTFGALTPVLQCVCSECNNFFSGAFEKDIYRSSPEALQRWKLGLKSSNTKGQIDSRRLKLNARGGEIDGLRLDPITNDVEAQVVARHHGTGEPAHLTLDDLRRLTPDQARQKYDFSSNTLVVWDANQHEQFSAELLRLGFMVNKRGKSRFIPMAAGTKLSATMTVALDSKTAQAMAKIAFNYLTITCGPDYALRTEFDEMRRFIRYGIKPVKSTVYASGMNEHAKRTPPTTGISHFLTLHIQDGKVVYARVALFSGYTYHAALSLNAPTDHAPKHLLAGFGHCFDVTKKTVRPIPAKILSRWNAPNLEAGTPSGS